MYYPTDNVKWIGHHLEADAAIWWRVIRDQITNFEEFKDIFTQKYWSQEKQDAIRDNLEYGRYNWKGNLTAVQYMERKLLESRQLTPAVTDRQLIKKIARHYGREIEIAVVTRGINSIHNLESLISEYATINQRSNRESGYMGTHDKVNARVNRGTMNATQPVHNKEVGWKQPPSHKKSESNTNKT